MDDTNLRIVDTYLEHWDRFAQGENELVPYLRGNKKVFEAELVSLLQGDDARAPSRLVFYVVVQIGGSIPIDSELGRACAHLLGPEFPLTDAKDGQPVYFAGNLYSWWSDRHEQFESYPLFDDWREREFAKSVVLPMYAALSKRKT